MLYVGENSTKLQCVFWWCRILLASIIRSTVAIKTYVEVWKSKVNQNNIGLTIFRVEIYVSGVFY